MGTGGKGTGAGTIFPVAEMARRQKKLVIPIFVRPSFERHEVEKRRFDHALGVIEQFDDARIRLIEILNDLGYADSRPEPQSTVWERMNRPIARGLRGLIYVLSDLSQVDPSDLSALFAGPGRLRIGFAEIDPPDAHEPDDGQVQEAVRDCWQNAYYAFAKPVGTSLVCIQGEWSNVVDAKIKGGLAALVADASDDHYNPLHARASHTPKPWGVTALFAEYTGEHPPLEIDWSLERRRSPHSYAHDTLDRGVPIVAAAHEIPSVVAANVATERSDRVEPEIPGDAGSVRLVIQDEVKPSFASLWEFAVAINRSEPAALALARDGTEPGIPLDGREVRKLLGTVWFRGVVPRLSEPWREKILETLVTSVPVADHALKIDRRLVRLSELSYAQLNDLFMTTYVADATRPDLELLLVVGKLWGASALKRFHFVAVSEEAERARRPGVLQGFRK
jgi:hypothetical protein